MGSTFMGLETSKRGLHTQQSALYTTGHNISNANTLGYSRQRVNMEATIGYPGTGLNAPKIPGHLGTGVQAQSVQRIRDGFIDTQYRQEANKLGYWESRSSAITQLEDVLNEPSDYGLAKSMDEFWRSLQDLSVNPENGGARAVVVQRGIAVADSFNYMHKSITQIKENAGKEIGISLKDVNSILQQVASLNEQIKAIEPNGYMPNDLYDARDTLLDELSTYLPIETSNTKSGGNALAIAEGSVNVFLKLKDGTSLKLVDGKDSAELRTFGPNKETDGITPTGTIEGFYIVKVDANGNDINLANEWTDPTPVNPVQQTITNFSDLGKLKSLVNSYGYATGDVTKPEKGLYPEMITKLNDMAKAFAKEFNKLHAEGTDLTGDQGGNFFVQKDILNGTDITAENIYVSKNLIDDPNLLAASNSAIGEGEPGNGKQALALANMKFASLDDLGKVSAQTYFEGLIGQLGVDGQQAARLEFNSATLQQAVTERRASVSSVSLDEEMTNMIIFQQAYNASARMITVVDETLDKIINGMGRVGL
ncbi:flagellar hook-associated protein FlgK [Psychrobacillus sp. MER TA 171]|uniref:flagellar hook-associated protein FlgK n=1 Tax=Psychrobacillus sp. MER TA 171 TaxID=2939577 RepID=UPI00203ADA3D|nr:flagellar hook-associated protein FlgK [Psychrobacillus sp. MER TA 171]MCM3356753.1 flagellar hook-associated protein FlgK [Psychrobacillus sp. MER TA 171]